MLTYSVNMEHMKKGFYDHNGKHKINDIKHSETPY